MSTESLSNEARDVFAAEPDYEGYKQKVRSEAIHAMNMTGTYAVRAVNSSRFSIYRAAEKKADEYDDPRFK